MEVLEATDNFSEENKLGQGWFGPVYQVRETKKKHMHEYAQRDRKQTKWDKRMFPWYIFSY
jgi:predicted Ser/Thr protein kinase